MKLHDARRPRLRPRAQWLALVPAVLMTVLSPAIAQPPATPGLALAGQIELARLVDLAAERLKLNVEYDASVLKGTVTLRLGEGVSDDELWALTNRVLASRGFTTVRTAGRRGDIVSVVKTGDAPALTGIGDGGPVGEPSPPTGIKAGYQSLVLRLEHRAPRDVVEALGKVLSKPGGSVVALGDPAVPGGLLLISDLAPRLEQAVEIVRLLDPAPSRTVLEEVPLANLTALQMATLVAQVSAKRELVSGEKIAGEVTPSASGRSVLLVAPEDVLGYWKDLIASLDQQERVETVTYTPPGFSAQEVAGLVGQAVRGQGPQDERWRLVVDELTGTLIVTATPTQHEAIRALLDRLAATPGAARRPVRSFVIRNRDVHELAEVLNGLVEAGVLSEQGSEERRPIESLVAPTLPPVGSIVEPGNGRPAEQPPGSAPSDLTSRGTPPRPGEIAEPPLLISIDEGTSTLIAMGDARLLEQLAVLIEQLDVRQPQVMLQVLLLTLTDAQTLNLGVELEALNLGTDTRWRLASLFGLSQRGGDGAPAFGNPAGFSGVVLNPGDFSVVLRALKTINKGRSLSMPQVLVGNNEQATLDSIVEQPFTSTNASNTVATTSFGGSSVAGTQVSIKPQIAEADHLILDYAIALSSFTGAAANENVPPPKQTNKLASVATIPDGFTVVVGGIELTDDSKGVSQVPLLGRVPLLGEAFKSRSKVSNRTRFYVFIRADVLRARGFEDLKHVSAAQAARAEVSDGFPVLEPRVIR